MLIVCPKCKKESEIRRVERGRRIECVCSAKFVLDAESVKADESTIDSIPHKIGEYPIKRLVGSGGMGVVYKGIHPTLGIDVAVKVLPAKYADIESFRERFIKSAKIAAKLIHPNIIKIYDIGYDSDGMLYLVMEYAARGNAFDLLLRKKRLSCDRASEIAKAVCKALIAAEKEGIVHRDIKPDNIMLTDEGTYKLCDLGLSKINPVKASLPDASSYVTESLSFTPLGTPAYMAPEQSLDAKNCDIRADIYSLGVTLYQFLSGRLPFGDTDALELRRRHSEDLAVPLGMIVKDIEPDMEYIVEKCMKKDKLARYRTASELLLDLEAFTLKHELPSKTRVADANEDDDLMLFAAKNNLPPPRFILPPINRERVYVLLMILCAVAIVAVLLLRCAPYS